MLFFDSISKKHIIKELLQTPFNIIVKKKVASTNTLLKEAARKGAEVFTVLIASQQISGRGRMGRSFYSPGGTGIYMSILLTPKTDANSLRITTDAAVACARAVERICGESAQIKWVNDIYVRNKKVCGILAEGVGESVVLGIGINVFAPKKGFPEEIKNRAGALFVKKKKGLREKIIAELLKEFLNIYRSSDKSGILAEYRERSIIIGKEILVLKGDIEEPATALGINEDYSLKVKKANGEISDLSSGDVSIKI